MSELQPEAAPGGGGRLLAAGAAVLMLCAAAVTGFTCFVLYRTGRAVQDLADTTVKLGNRLDGIGEKGERVAGAAAGVSERVEKLTSKVDGLTERLEAAEEWADALRGGAARISEAEDQLVRELLAAVRGSDLKFVRGGQEKTPLRMYAWLYAKYQIMRPTVASADEFVTKVASEALTGAPYQVIANDGARRPLGDWLKERLAALRAAGKK